MAQGMAAVHTVVEENGAPVLFAARLKVVDGQITEIETMAVRNRTEGVLFAPENLREPATGMTYVPKPEERMSRSAMVALASRYPAGLRAGSFVTRIEGSYTNVVGLPVAQVLEALHKIEREAS